MVLQLDTNVLISLESTEKPKRGQLFECTCVEDLIEEAADQNGSDVELGEDQRQTAVTRLPQAQTLLALLVNAVAAQHAFKQLQRGNDIVSSQKNYFTPKS